MKLDNISNQVYIVAVNEANLQSHEYVTPEHFLYAALMFDIGKDIIENSGGNSENIIFDLQSYFDKYMARNNSESPVESSAFVRMFEMAAAQALNSEKNEVTIGDLLVIIFNLTESYAVYIMAKNGVDRLSMLKYISHGMKKSDGKSNDYIDRDQTRLSGAREKNGKNILAVYAVNLTERAALGELDPLIGREDVLERTIQVLCRRIKNNPIHVGDAGVGKTAIVEGLAQKIAAGLVPEALRDANLFYIDMGTIVAGTKFRGDFEERLIKLLDAASAEKNSIIYIDEIHNLVGAGSVSGSSMDAASILKPYLSKGNLRFIGSTTYEEYIKYFEKDNALTRRFQRIDVIEPTIDDAVKILKGIKCNYESYHGVTYGDDVILLACQLSVKYLNDRRLPDKAIDVMDETGAFLRMQHREDSNIAVTKKDIEKTVALMAKVPENSISENEIEKLKTLEDRIKAKVYGQDRAVGAVVNAIKASRSGLNETEKPVANLLFVGPTGVGKTEIAKQLAENLDIGLQRFDMSEYQEAHSVARLIGSPPGYVGYEEGGLLTGAIRKQPYCVLLLDEIEKAHPNILNILLQIMDYGVLTDNSGKKADFRNVILIMTSNAGAKELDRNIIGFDENKINLSVIDKEVERVFSPEFRNRLDEIITFNHIDKDMAVLITKKSIEDLEEKLKNKKVKLKLTDEAINWISEKGLSKKYGAREITRIINQDIKKMLIDDVLFGKLANGGRAVISIKNNEIKMNVTKR